MFNNRRSTQADPVAENSLNMSSISQTAKTENLSIHNYSEQMESQRLAELKSTALSMKGNLVHNGRCPKCTLKPPCKHYANCNELPGL